MVLAVIVSPVSMHSTPSRRSSLRNLESRAARARMVSLKSRVRGIALLLQLPLLVILPVGKSSMNIVLLPLFGAATKQDHQSFTVFAEIHTVSRTKIDPVFEYARTNAFDIREITERQSCKGRCNLGGCLSIQTVEPGSIRAVA